MAQLIENKQGRPTLIDNEPIVFGESHQTGQNRINWLAPDMSPVRLWAFAVDDKLIIASSGILANAQEL